MSSYYGVTSTAVSLAVNLLIVGTLFAAGIALTFRLGRTLRPRLRYAAALIAFLAAAALPINSTLFGTREMADAFAATADSERRPSSANVVSNQSGGAAVDSSRESDGAAGTPSTYARPRPKRPGGIDTLLSAFISLSAESRLSVGFLGLWIFVAVALVGREAFGYAHLARARRTWRSAGPKTLDTLRWPSGYQLFISEREGPYTVGLFRPAVVMPAGLLERVSSDEARLIARHELAHARWRDPLANALVRVVRALLWPSLPLWFLARVVRVEREAASDLSALAASRHEEIKGAVTEYAELLVSVARLSGREGAARRRYHWAATEVGEHVDLESRVLRLLTFSARTTRTRLLLSALALTATAWAAVSLPIATRPVLSAPGASMQGEAAPAPRESQARHSASQNLFSATEGEAAQAAATAQTNPTRGENQNIVLQASARPGARAGQGEAGQGFADEVAALGYTRLSPEQAGAMRAYGVSAEYVAEMAAAGYDKLAADTLINFRLLGVNAAYVSEMGNVGYGALPPNTLIDFRLYGVSPAYVRELAALGLSEVPARQLVAFRRKGIDAGYVKQLSSQIAGGLSPNQLLALRNLGVTEAYVRELKARGAENLTADQVIDARTQKLAAGAPFVRGNTDNE